MVYWDCEPFAGILPRRRTKTNGVAMTEFDDPRIFLAAERRIASLDLLLGMSHCLTAFVTEGNSYWRQKWHEHLLGRPGRNWFKPFERDITPDQGK